ncbi:MAG: class I SAM-dependent methyltransferase [Halobacteriales archaeon]
MSRDVPETVRAALADRPVAGATCLEAGAGAGNATAGLLEAGAGRVYAVTDDPDHAAGVRERIASEGADRAGDSTDQAVVARADIRALPIEDGTIEVITAHGLFNVLPPSSLPDIVAELTRVAAPGCHLLIDDYEPPPGDAEVRDLFAAENAATELSSGRPALTFYPASVLRRLFVAEGWEFDRKRTLLDPVPWTADHVSAHADAARAAAEELPGQVCEALTGRIDSLEESIGEERAGEMYSLALCLPE